MSGSVSKDPKNQTDEQIKNENNAREQSIAEFLKKSEAEIRKVTACQMASGIGKPTTPPKGTMLYVHKHWLVRPSDKAELDRIAGKISEINMAFGIPANMPKQRAKQLEEERKKLQAKIETIYKRGSDYLRETVGKAADWACVPPAMLAAVLQNENSPKATPWQRALQGAERNIQRLIGIGSTGFGNVKPETLKHVTNLFKKFYKRSVLGRGIKNQGQSKHAETDIYHAAAALRDGLNKAWSAERSLNLQLGGRYKYYPYFGGTVTEDVAIRAMGHYNGMGNAALSYGKTAMGRIRKKLYFMP